MLQIVHDVAPGASLAFYTAEVSEADFANGITALAAAGAKVIADDVGYFDEPFYQDGVVAQAINAVEAQGVAYFSAAGNDGNATAHNGSYENTAPSFATLASSGSNSGEYLLNFDTSGATTTTALPIQIDAKAPGEFTAVVVEWDQPYVTGAPNSGGATSQIDVCVTGATGADPVQILIIANPANAAASTPKETLNLVVGLAGSTAAPGRVIVAVQTDGQTDPPITQFATNGPTLQGHPGAAAAAVGAAFYFETPGCGTTPAVIENFSSQGGAPVLFDVSGARLATPTLRQKPDFVAPDGVNDTFLGFTLASAGVTGSNGELNTTIAACQNNPNYPNFFGTSAATPHAAGIAALITRANSAVTPTQIYAALRNSALPMAGGTPSPTSVYNFISGYGFIQADAAMSLIPAGAPTITAAASSVVEGTSTTLTWSSINTTSCTAAGSWSGHAATSGSQTVTPTALGTATYTLTCANAAGASAASSVGVTVTASTGSSSSSGTGSSADPPAGGKSGGGGLDWLTLFALGALGLSRLRRRSWSPRARLPPPSYPSARFPHDRICASWDRR